MTSEGFYIVRGMRASHVGPTPYYRTTENLHHATIFGARLLTDETLALRKFGKLTSIPAYSTRTVTIGIEK